MIGASAATLGSPESLRAHPLRKSALFRAVLERETDDYALRLILDYHFSPEPHSWTVRWPDTVAEILTEEA